MLKIGLTGSIAVGKSFVCGVFRELGASVLDADCTAREVVAPGTLGWQLIIEQFGSNILLPNNEIDRATLGAIVFADEWQRQLLNRIVHPLVIEKQNDWLRTREAESPNEISIIDAALMIESDGYRRFEKIIVVWCDSATQLQRLVSRNKLNEQEALKRINAQMPQEEKKRYADFLIDTTQGFESARRRTFEVFEQLKLL
ncbi:MAG: dephospho-CoA kinase [Acidobacteriota bacterium]|nr:dephospho-CoA kinase [Acidobacteriota bacterium]